MIDHLTLTVTDYQKAKTFYEAALAPLGYGIVMTYGEFAGFGEPKKPVLWLKEGPAPQAPMHLAFAAKNRGAVDGFYKAALAAGASDNGPPGPRAEYHPHYYGAFVIDPLGHPIEAACHTPQGAKRAARKTGASAKKSVKARAKSAKPGKKKKKR